MLIFGDGTYNCKVWRVNKVSCKHALASIWANMLEVSNYIHESISKTIYLKTYTSSIHITFDQDLWLEVSYNVILSPYVKVNPINLSCQGCEVKIKTLTQEHMWSSVVGVRNLGITKKSTKSLSILT